MSENQETQRMDYFHLLDFLAKKPTAKVIRLAAVRVMMDPPTTAFSA